MKRLELIKERLKNVDDTSGMQYAVELNWLKTCAPDDIRYLLSLVEKQRKMLEKIESDAFTFGYVHVYKTVADFNESALKEE